MAAGLLAVALGGLAMSAPAAAQLDPCDDVVIDLTDQVDVDAVAAEVDDLDNRATVRVRVLEFSDGGDLDRSVNRLLANCPEWADGPGGRRWDLAVLAVSLRERQASLYYGGAWTDALDGRWERLIDDEMAPFFAAGDLTGGLVSGLAAVDALLPEVAEPEPELDELDPGGPVVVEGERGPEEAPTYAGAGEAEDGDDGDTTTALVLAGFATAGVVGLGVWAVARHRDLVAQRTEIGAEHAEITGVLVGADRGMDLAGERFTALSGVVGGGTAERLDRWVGETRAAVRQGYESLQRIEDLDGDRVGDLNRSGAAAAGPRLAAVESTVTTASEQVRAVEAELVRVAALPDVLVERRGQQRMAFASARADVGRLASDGWRMDGFTAELDELEGALDRLDLDARPIDLDRLEQAMNGIEAGVLDTHQRLNDVPARRQRLRAQRDELVQLARSERGRVATHRGELETVRRVHAPESWAEVDPHPDRASVLLDAVEHRLRPLGDDRGPLSMVEQDWDRAQSMLEGIGDHLREADELLDAVDERLVALAHAREAAPQLLDEGRLLADQLGAFIAAHDADLDPAFDDALTELRNELVTLRSLLGEERPNLLEIRDRAERAVRGADDLLGEARDAHAAAEALRARARREFSSAQAAVDQVARYLTWKVFAFSAHGELNSLRDRLSRLAGSGDAEWIISESTHVNRAATNLYRRLRQQYRPAAVALGSGAGRRGGSFSSFGRSSSGGGFSSGGGRSGGGSRGGGGGTRGW